MCTEENKTNSEEKNTIEDSNVVIWQGGINGVVVTMPALICYKHICQLWFATSIMASFGLLQAYLPALVCYKHICQLWFATSTFAEYKQWFIYRRNIITLLAAMSV